MNMRGLVVVSGAGEELGVTPSLLINSVSTGKHFVGEIGCRNDVSALIRSSRQTVRSCHTRLCGSARTDTHSERTSRLNAGPLML